jgi:REP element-mobilizing transposase RayT
MRHFRSLAQGVWYAVHTSVNNTEPLFWSWPNQDLFKQVLYEVRQIYGFSLCGLCFSGPQVSFYIKPDDGLQLPEIMQWIKQTFAVRFNVLDGRTGHIWGDRYWSEILPGEPPEDAEAYVFAPVVCGGRKGWRRIAAGGVGGRGKRGAVTGNPARDAEGWPRTGRRAVKPPPRPNSPRRATASRG